MWAISDNWVIRTLEWALESWNGKLGELWELLTQTPESFKGGDIWEVIVTINSALQGVGYGLLVLFFAMGVFQSAASFREIQRPEYALRHFIRFAAAKVAVGYGMEIMTAIFSICGDIVQTVMGSIGGAVGTATTLPAEMVEAIEEVGFLMSIPLWVVSMLGALLIIVLSFVLPLFPALHVYRPVPAAAGVLCRRGDFRHRQGVHQKLCRRMHGGGGHYPCLPHLLRVHFQQHPGGGHVPARCDHGVSVCRPAHFQHAGAHRPCERRGKNCKGDVRLIGNCIIDRFWAMPSRNTFSIKPVRELIDRYWMEGVSIDPFANTARLASVTNDLDPAYDTDCHMDATDFLQTFADGSVDIVLYDPPFSSRQVSECYRRLGHTVNWETTQNSYWRRHKEQISRIVRPGGLVFSFGWNSGGIGLKYGFEKIHIRLICHGGHHNDTIAVVERRT